jgi:hypothetical protein
MRAVPVAVMNRGVGPIGTLGGALVDKAVRRSSSADWMKRAALPLVCGRYGGVKPCFRFRSTQGLGEVIGAKRAVVSVSNRLMRTPRDW